MNEQLELTSKSSGTEFSRIIAAAVINKQFRNALLKDPQKTISAGYCGEPFNLSFDQKQKISSFKGRSLEDFASQLAQI